MFFYLHCKYTWSTACCVVHQYTICLLKRFPHDKGQKFLSPNYLHIHCTVFECRILEKWHVLVISSVWMERNCSLHSLVTKKASCCLSPCSAYAQGCCISWLICPQTVLWCQCQVLRNVGWTPALKQWTTELVSVTRSRKTVYSPFFPS
jgi:hypothetical protein